MYAVVRSGGRQYRVVVGDVLSVNRVAGERGDTVSLPAVLVVDGDSVTSAAADLADFPVTGEVIEHLRGPKVRILKFKNKTGYKKKQGHRQELTRLKVTAIGTSTSDTTTADSKSGRKVSTAKATTTSAAADSDSKD